MAWNYTQYTIRQLVTIALAKVGNITPTDAQVTDALLQFSMMMGEWYTDPAMVQLQSYGLFLPEHDYTNPDIKVELPDGYANAIVWGLAARLMTDYGVKDELIIAWAKKTATTIKACNTRPTDMFPNPTCQVH